MAKKNIRITYEVAHFFITHPIGHLDMFCGAAVAGAFNINSHMGTVAMRNMLESGVKIIIKFARPELAKVDNEFDYWNFLMVLVRGALEGGVLGSMSALGFQLLNRAIFGVGQRPRNEYQSPMCFNMR